MNRTLGAWLLIAAMTGCATEGYDPSVPDLEAGALAAAKADGAFGAQEIDLGALATGEAAGEAFSLFAIELGETDQVRVTLARTAGDLQPAAYLYRGTEIYLSPDDYRTGDGTVTLDYTIAEGGQHHIVVKAYRGRGAGEFELVTECTGGACRGFAADPIQRQSNCIESAAQCAIADLGRWNGRVGEVRARSIFNDCLDELEDEACRTACDEEGAPVCGEVVSHLPSLADQSGACRTELSECLGACSEIGGFYGADSIGESAAMVCWTGYFGNCAEYIAGHADCGGTDYDRGTPEACYARCDGAEGAWDEGPFDGCRDSCNDALRANDDFIRDVARGAGEYVDGSEDPAFAPLRYEDVPSVVTAEVDRVIATFNSQAERDMRTDHAFVGETVLSISRDGAIVGYMVGVDYAIDHPLFDGGGVNLYLNVLGETVSDEEWSG